MMIFRAKNTESQTHLQAKLLTLKELAPNCCKVSTYGCSPFVCRSLLFAARVKQGQVLCHNLCVVIQSMYELGIDASFGIEAA